MSAIASSRPGRTGILRAILDGTRRQIAIRHNRRVLYALSDRELRDIGINRGAIDGFVGEAIDGAVRIR